MIAKIGQEVSGGASASLTALVLMPYIYGKFDWPSGTTFRPTKRRTEFGSQPRFESTVCVLRMLSLDRDVIYDRVYSFVLFLRTDLNLK